MYHKGATNGTDSKQMEEEQSKKHMQEVLDIMDKPEQVQEVVSASSDEDVMILDNTCLHNGDTKNHSVAEKMEEIIKKVEDVSWRTCGTTRGRPRTTPNSRRWRS